MARFPFFPIPEPGETIYSTICRCAARSGLPEQHLLQALTGQVRRANIMSAIVGYVALFSDSMPDGHPWCDPNRLIWDHTALPYYVYFMKEQERQSWALEVITRRDSHPLSLALGLTTYPCPTTPPHPRYCLQCVAEQKQKLGFSFFRREHQLPGVLVCYEHGCTLYHGCEICGPYPIKRQGLCMPGRCACDKIIPLSIGNITPEDLEPLVWLARESAFLVNSNGTARGDVCADLLSAAISKGFARGSLVDYKKLATGIESRFGTETLRQIGVRAWSGERPSAWLRRLFYAERYNRKGASILRLLVIGGLFDSVKTFEAEQSSPCSHSTQVKAEVRKRGAEAKAVLPDLKPLIAKGCGLSAIAERYGVGMYAVAREIRRQGLRYPLSKRIKNELGNELEAIQNDLAAGHSIKEIRKRYDCSEELLILIQIDKPELVELHRQNAKLNTVKKHRKLLADFLAKNPSASRSDIQKELPATYEFFLRVDKEWFYKNLPKRKKTTMEANRRKRTPFIDWQHVDIQKAKELETQFEKLFKSDIKPIWLTKNGMLKRIGIQQKYLFDPSKFPQVTATLNQKIETRKAFIARRLDWAIGKLAMNEKSICLDRLRRVACLNYATLRGHSKLIYDLAKKHGACVELGLYPVDAIVFD